LHFIKKSLKDWKIDIKEEANEMPKRKDDF